MISVRDEARPLAPPRDGRDSRYFARGHTGERARHAGGRAPADGRKKRQERRSERENLLGRERKRASKGERGREGGREGEREREDRKSVV